MSVLAFLGRLGPLLEDVDGLGDGCGDGQTHQAGIFDDGDGLVGRKADDRCVADKTAADDSIKLAGHQNDEQSLTLADEALPACLAFQRAGFGLGAGVEHTRHHQTGDVVDGHKDDQRLQRGVPAAKQRGDDPADDADRGANGILHFIHLPLHRPSGLIRPGVDMHPAGLAGGVLCVLRVAPDAAPGEQQALRIGGDSFHRHALDVEIRRPAQKVLAGLAAADGGVVGSGAVAAGDMHRLSEVLPDALQQHHKLLVEEHDVAAGAAELPHSEAGRELPGGVPGHGIFFDSDRDHDLSFFYPLTLYCKCATLYSEGV
nr:MAG TPA: hypothetical protein [Caudoviricetes sp.]